MKSNPAKSARDRIMLILQRVLALGATFLRIGIENFQDWEVRRQESAATVQKMKEMILEVGRAPVERDSLYREIVREEEPASQGPSPHCAADAALVSRRYFSKSWSIAVALPMNLFRTALLPPASDIRGIMRTSILEPPEPSG